MEDYFVRCEKCHKSTWPTYELQSVIDEWNDAVIDTKIDTPQEEFENKVNVWREYLQEE